MATPTSNREKMLDDEVARLKEILEQEDFRRNQALESMAIGYGSDFLYRLITSVAAAAVVPLLFWLGGFDFDQRGDAALACGVMTIGVFILWFSKPQ